MFTDRPLSPPFDDELLPAVTAMRETVGRLVLDDLPQIRSAMVPGGGADVTAGGRLEMEAKIVGGVEGVPDLSVTVIRPAAASADEVKTRVPGIYYIHGGGMVVGGPTDGIGSVLPYALDYGAVIISPDYRLAPEHPHPAPVEDCYLGLRWMAENAEQLGIDPDAIIIAGASAGGGLAAATALLARDRKFPALAHQVLMCPMLDDRFDTHSSRMLDDDGVWDRNDNLIGWRALLGEKRGGDDVSPYAAPARANDLAGLPRTFIDVGGSEGFRDECIDFARRLSAAGVLVDFHLWGGGFHGFDAIAPEAAISRASVLARDDYFRRALNSLISH